MDNSEMRKFSSENPYLEMQTSFLSLLLKMATPLTATHYLQNSSNSNSKMTTSAKTQHSPSSQTNSQTLTNTPNQLCETNESERGLLKAWRGCFWRESTLNFPLKPLNYLGKAAPWVLGGHGR